jgi:hypothetical protein
VRASVARGTRSAAREAPASASRGPHAAAFEIAAVPRATSAVPAVRRARFAFPRRVSAAGRFHAPRARGAAARPKEHALAVGRDAVAPLRSTRLRSSAAGSATSAERPKPAASDTSAAGQPRPAHPTAASLRAAGRLPSSDPGRWPDRWLVGGICRLSGDATLVEGNTTHPWRWSLTPSLDSVPARARAGAAQEPRIATRILSPP